MKGPDLSLYLVTDQRISWDRCLSVVRESVLGGVTAVQLREKGKSMDEVLHRARQLLKVLGPLRIPLIINDHVEVAKTVGAQGVHLGKADCDVRAARSLLGPRAIIGLSVERVQDFERSDWQYCDYVSASPVFPTGTKDDAACAMGLEGLKALRAACSLPLVAIGGVNRGNAAVLSLSGVDGICVVSSICLSNSPRQAAVALKRAFQKPRRENSHG